MEEPVRYFFFMILPCELIYLYGIILLSGRAGEKGTAFTLVTPKDYEFAGHLVRSLEGVGQEVPKPLLDLALQVYNHIITFY